MSDKIIQASKQASKQASRLSRNKGRARSPGRMDGSTMEICWLDGECRTQHRIRTDATLLKSNGGKFYLQKGDKLVIADWEGLKTLY